MTEGLSQVTGLSGKPRSRQGPSSSWKAPEGAGEAPLSFPILPVSVALTTSPLRCRQANNLFRVDHLTHDPVDPVRWDRRLAGQRSDRRLAGQRSDRRDAGPTGNQTRATGTGIRGGAV